jgi:carbon-monoxide dehydrogenase medium subunit
VNRLPGLGAIADEAGVMSLGALARQRAVERWATARAPLVAAALRHVGHTAIRARGTVAGSLGHADPAAELPALFVCLDGVATARSERGERTIAAPDLFVGPMTTSLRGDEMIVETRWPLPGPVAGWGLHEVARRHGDFALVGAIAVVSLREGRVDDARISLFGAGPTPSRATAAEKALGGAAPDARVLRDAGRLAAEGLDPHDDVHASAHYRKRVAATLVERALADAVRRATAHGS